MTAVFDPEQNKTFAAELSLSEAVANPDVDSLAGHLFRAEIELNFALLEAQTTGDLSKISLVEFALAAVQCCRESDSRPNGARARPI
ncbi:hypothetical protein SAMN06265338_103261 [Rhodoblastus acidophilus]|uniref:Uncharacterized protein n=1 Tax=Rhodoblastus acidophilus TaxID=1074 RepID=A0A212RC53_RHOAC|nr:hypothetical protein [Rhodoblastus acidophilus]MCW2317516.1 hypothetical protein [Rhodoblastus acidophilus]PPQ39413.1 hypothetical protein CKO16_06575 [Rhodoblastus acidophilus]RAI16273.1 hypothetical protein CH337_22235 [Rhodoblastus acidophilus]SNB69635.1 hypothetical protein SAMN06265338_103261 [Rhodoblastus acidophilus]